MNKQAFLRQFIRNYGELRTIVILTVLLVLAATPLALLMDWVAHGVAHVAALYIAIFMTLLIGPVVLYQFVNLISQLDRSEEKLRALSVMDDLTDVYNRRFFLEQAEKELAKAQRYGTVFSILAIDIDHFRKINDRYGHLAGDAVLQAVANTCMNNLRSMDIFARFGVGEFMFLIPEADKTNVATFAERISTALANTPVIHNREEIRFTVSIGIKVLDAGTHSLEALLKMADEAVLEAKRRGRNCIVMYNEDVAFLSSHQGAELH